ncbi:MAG: SRPBCC domain-containing protein [Cyclobacteriaceae bacterium]
MKNFETSINIKAAASSVWKVLMDHENYATWNPFITEISGATEVGGSLSLMIRPEGKKPMMIQPTVLKNESETEFRWIGHLFVKGLFDGEHYFKLEPIGKNETKLIHGENFSGLMVAPILKMVGESTLKGFHAMNLALKNQSENL